MTTVAIGKNVLRFFLLLYEWVVACTCSGNAIVILTKLLFLIIGSIGWDVCLVIVNTKLDLSPLRRFCNCLLQAPMSLM